jgi:hypothetical protein
MATSNELSISLNTERQEMAKFWKDHLNADGVSTLTAEEVGQYNKRGEALGAKQTEFENLLIAERNAAENEAKLAPQGRMVKDGAPAVETKDSPAGIETKAQLAAAMKSAFEAHRPALAALANGDLTKGFPRIELGVDIKTIVALSDHYAAATRLQTTGSALFYGSVEDLFQSLQSGSNNVEYFIQTTDTDNASFVAENTAVTDSAFSWTKTTDEVEDVQTWIPISRDMLRDEPFMLSTIQGMLATRLTKIISKEAMYGTGTTPHLWGCSVRTGFQTQAKGTDPVFDAVLKAITLVAVTGDSTPDAIVIHPTDWQNIVLTRTVDGIYLLGNPGNAPANPMLWGLPVRVSTTVAAAAGTAVVGAFKTAAALVYNGGLVVETSTEHSTYFTERKVALALSQRMSAVHFRPSGFAKITGL